MIQAPRASTGDAIARARTAAGITQEELGRLTGLGQSVISRIESGHRKVDSAELVAIAKALGIEAVELLTAGEVEPAPTYEVVALRLKKENPKVAAGLKWIPRFLANMDLLESLDSNE
jgi:transcriptional regulator with XRE-family HTH domain